MSGRHVDQAMDDERPEKKVIRDLWVDIVRAHDKECVEAGHDGLLYLTLSGRKGRDLALLIEQGIIELTEVKGLSPNSASRIVAVENSPPAVLELQARFPGLKILEQPIQSLIRGESLTRFPEGEHEAYCKAAVVNLDVNQPLRVEATNGGAVIFPLVLFIYKFALLHCALPERPWTLLLTLHGEAKWDAPVWNWVVNYLRDNINNVQNFSDHTKTVLGDELHARIQQGDANFASQQEELHQKLLLALVPKLIADQVRQQNWLLETMWGYAYGKPGDNKAPMVTWAMRFSQAQGKLPDVLYRENVGRILGGAGELSSAGKIIQLI